MDEPEYLSLTSLKFINLPESLKCVQCQNPVSCPVQIPCGHLVCTECVTAVKKLGRCPSDDHEEGDCMDIQPETIFNKDKSAVRELKKLKTFCPFSNYGCKEVLAYQNIRTHTETCRYKKTPCPHEGCDAALSDSRRQDHVNICQYRPVNCDHCGESVTWNRKQDHLEECQNVPTECPNRCGTTLPKDQVADHIRDNCYKGNIPCPLKSLGCVVESERQHMTEHMNTHAQRHWEMSAHRISTLELKVVKLQNQQMDVEQKFKCENTQFKTQIQQKSSEVQHLNDILSEDKKKHTKLMGELGAENSKLRETLSKISALVIGLESKVTKLDLQQKNSGATDGANSLRSLPFLQEQIEMLDMRLQCQETTSYNGTLIWRISDYKKRKDDALRGTPLSLYSQPFYTSRDGYKICCRMYLNGDGSGKGKYISLFFALMKGDYDPLLRWPFQQKVTMTLLHQDRGEDLRDTFNPDVTSSSFQRPQREMNVASGCPMFAKHDAIEKHSSKYLVDDTMFLRIEVNTSDCHIPSRRR